MLKAIWAWSRDIRYAAGPDHSWREWLLPLAISSLVEE